MSHGRTSIVLPVVYQAAAPANQQTGKALRTLLAAGAIAVMLLCFFCLLFVIGLETGPVILPLAMLMAITPVPVYASLLLWLDRFEPEPVRLLLIAFGWGATIAAFTAFLLNTVGTVIVDEQFGAEAAEIYGGSISAPIVEEGAKGAILFGLLIFRRREINSVLDGIVYAGMVGLGFAMTENVLYYGQGAVEDGFEGAAVTLILRGIMSPFAHPVFTAATGIGIALAATSRHGFVRALAPPLGLLVAMVLHSLWNTAASTEYFFGVYLLVMVPIFACLIAIVFVSRHNERQLVRRHIADGLGGMLTSGEVEMLASLKARKRARQYLKGRAGKQAARELAEFQEAVTEYAHHLERGIRGLNARDAKNAAYEAELTGRLRGLHQRLLTYGAPQVPGDPRPQITSMGMPAVAGPQQMYPPQPHWGPPPQHWPPPDPRTRR